MIKNGMGVYLIQAMDFKEQMVYTYISVGVNGEDATNKAIKFYNLNENEFDSFVAEHYINIVGYEIEVNIKIEEELDITDEVGGCHGGGVGWNPQGIFCGECSSSTCKGCVNEYIKD